MVGIPLDPEALGDARCELDVDLHDLQQSSELRSQMFDPAGSTPWRPEIDEDENRSHRGENARLTGPGVLVHRRRVDPSAPAPRTTKSTCAHPDDSTNPEPTARVH